MLISCYTHTHMHIYVHVRTCHCRLRRRHSLSCSCELLLFYCSCRSVRLFPIRRWQQLFDSHTHTHTNSSLLRSHSLARSLSGTDSLSLLRAVTPALPISRYRSRSVQLIIILNRQLSFVLILCFQFASARAIYAHSLRSCFFFLLFFFLLCFCFCRALAIFIVAYFSLFVVAIAVLCAALPLPLPLLETFLGLCE